MKTGAISLRQATAFAWPTFKKHWRLHVSILFTMLLAWVVLEVVVIYGQRFGILLWTAAHVAFLIFFASLQVGFLQSCLALRDCQAPTFAGVFAPFSIGAKFLVAEVFYLLLVTVGLALLLAPGIYIAARYAFFGFYIAEGKGIADAFRSAAWLTARAILPLAGTLAALLLFNLLGTAILGIGLLLTVPVSGLLWADIYRQLSPNASSG